MQLQSACARFGRCVAACKISRLMKRILMDLSSWVTKIPPRHRRKHHSRCLLEPSFAAIALAPGIVQICYDSFCISVALKLFNTF